MQSVVCMMILLMISQSYPASGNDDFLLSRQSPVNSTTTETPAKADLDVGCKLKERPGFLKEIRFTAWCDTLMSGNNLAKLSVPAEHKTQCWSRCTSKSLDDCLFSVYHPNNNTCWLIPSKTFCSFGYTDISTIIFSSTRRALVQTDKYYSEYGSSISYRNFPMATTDEWNLDCMILCEMTLNCVMGYYVRYTPPTFPICQLFAIGSTSNPTTLSGGGGFIGFKFI